MLPPGEGAWDSQKQLLDDVRSSPLVGGYEQGHGVSICRALFGGGYHPGKMVLLGAPSLRL